jgi:hypothetical protein
MSLITALEVASWPAPRPVEERLAHDVAFHGHGVEDAVSRWRARASPGPSWDERALDLAAGVGFDDPEQLDAVAELRAKQMSLAVSCSMPSTKSSPPAPKSRRPATQE